MANCVTSGCRHSIASAEPPMPCSGALEAIAEVLTRIHIGHYSHSPGRSQRDKSLYRVGMWREVLCVFLVSHLFAMVKNKMLLLSACITAATSPASNNAL